MALILASQVGKKGKQKKRPFQPLPKRSFTRWGPIPKRKRWGNSKAEITDDVKHIADVAAQLDPKEAKLYFLKLQLGQNAQKQYNPLAALLQNPDELSPSPEPIYDTQGRRLNTREVRYKEKLEEERNRLLTEILELDPNFKIPANWKKPVYKKKIMVPTQQFPDVNFFGLIVGPRGMTQKRISKETGCSCVVRGRGSFAPGKPGRTPQPDDDEPMSVVITGNTQKAVDKATKMVMDLIDQSKFGKAQRQLVELKSMLGWGGNVTKRCRICGGVGHPVWKCPDRPGADWDPADVQCELCGEVSHVTKDCKLYKKGMTVKSAMTLDEEYKSFLKDLAGDGPMSSNTHAAITGTIDPTMKKFPTHTKHDAKKNQAMNVPANNIKSRTGTLTGNAYGRGGQGGSYRGGRGGQQRGGGAPYRGRGGAGNSYGRGGGGFAPPQQPWRMGPPAGQPQQFYGAPQTYGQRWLQPMAAQPMAPYGYAAPFGATTLAPPPVMPAYQTPHPGYAAPTIPQNPQG